MASDGGPREGSVRLPDGRTLAFAEWGDPDGRPVLGCHGSPSSRLERHVEDSGAYRRGGGGVLVPGPAGVGGVGPPPRRPGAWRAGGGPPVSSPPRGGARPPG